MRVTQCISVRLGTQDVYELVFILEWAHCSFHKKHAEKHYAELVFFASSGIYGPRSAFLSYPGSKKHRIEASICVPRMFNHTHSNNMMNI
jgi:hypothetical protein